MSNNQKIGVRIYSCEGDYAPVLVITDEGYAILEGDNIHDSGYESAADGAEGAFSSIGIESTVEYVNYDYQDSESNDMNAEHEAFLIEHGHESFLNKIKKH